jgi:hypothetical protein
MNLAEINRQLDVGCSIAVVDALSGWCVENDNEETNHPNGSEHSTEDPSDFARHVIPPNWEVMDGTRSEIRRAIP